MDSDRKKFIKFSLEVKTYYPIFKIESDDLLICDNDGDIDWDYLGIPQPTSDFLDSVKGYNKAFNNVNIKGGISGSTTVEGMTAIKRSYFHNFYQEMGRENGVIKDRDTTSNPKYWDKEDLGKHTDENIPDNDID